MRLNPLLLPGDAALPGTARQRWIAAGAVLGLMLAAFSVGRGCAPTRVVTQTRTVHDTITIAGTSDTNATGTAVDHTIEETHKPDGTVVVVKHDVVEKIVYRDVVQVQTVEKRVEVEKVKLVERAAPQWRVGLLAGLTTSGSRVPVAPMLGLPGFVPLAAGVTLERRIVGPLWGGAWVNTDKSAGIAVSLEF